MATYCISDIHGRYEEFISLLDKVSMNKSDTLYTLGDIIDRGSGSAEMLQWAVNCKENVKFLLGNHEDMAASVIIPDPIGLRLRYENVWSFNRGQETVNQLLEKTSADWRINELVPWLKQLPAYQTVNVNGKEWMLVHAGFSCAAFNEYYTYGVEDGNFDHFSRHEIYDLTEYGFGMQNAQAMIWARLPWLCYPYETKTPVVFGHTPVTEKLVDFMIERGLPVKGSGEKFLHMYNRINIDCGFVPGNLGMLRLDDMEEFYLKN